MYALYFLSSAGVTCSNDGSHFALANAFADGEVSIDRYVSYTTLTDYAQRDGTYYSDRTPGTAILAVPFVKLGRGLEKSGLWPAHGPSRPAPAEVLAMHLPALAGSLAVLFVYLVLRLWVPGRRALILAGVYAVGTLTWLEATHLFSHALTMATGLAAVYLAVRTPRLTSRGIVGIFALLGLSAILEIHAGLFLPIVGIYLLATGKVRFVRDLRAIGIGVAVFLAIYAVLLTYNHAALGEWTAKSNKANPVFEFERSYREALSGNPLEGLDQVCTSFGRTEVWWDWSQGRENQMPGLFVVMPMLLLSIPGAVFFWRRRRAEALLVLSMLASYLAVASFRQVTLVRYLMPVLPYAFLPLAFLPRRPGLDALFALLAIVSVTRVVYGMNIYYGRSLANPFPYAREWPSLVLVLLLAGGAIAGVSRGRRLLRSAALRRPNA